MTTSYLPLKTGLKLFLSFYIAKVFSSWIGSVFLRRGEDGGFADGEWRML